MKDEEGKTTINQLKKNIKPKPKANLAIAQQFFSSFLYKSYF